MINLIPMEFSKMCSRNFNKQITAAVTDNKEDLCIHEYEVCWPELKSPFWICKLCSDVVRSMKDLSKIRDRMNDVIPF